jgi:hypothetical protein
METIFHNNNFHTQTNKIFQSLKELKENNDILKYLNYLNLDESTYILSLKSKLTKLHIFLKQTPKNVKINAFSIHVVHLWFINCKYKYSIYLGPICNCNILHIIYDKNK